MHVALLRGINVGGKSAVSMAVLKATFERLGFERVRTYINSGNVVFAAPDGAARPQLTEAVGAAIVRDFGVPVPVLLRTGDELAALAAAVPAEWVNDELMRCDVFFLWPDIDDPSVLEKVPTNPDIEDLVYVPGALVRRIDRKNATRSPMTRVAGMEIYKQMTVRNINTVRTLRDLAA